MCQLYKLFSCRSYVSVSCLVIGFVSILDQVLDVYELYNSKVNWLVNDVMNIFLKKMIRTTTSNMNTITKSRTSSGIAFIWGQNEMAQFILVDGRLTNLLWKSITPELINRPNSKASVRNSRGSTMSLVFNWYVSFQIYHSGMKENSPRWNVSPVLGPWSACLSHCLRDLRLGPLCFMKSKMGNQRVTAPKSRTSKPLTPQCSYKLIALLVDLLKNCWI